MKESNDLEEINVLGIGRVPKHSHPLPDYATIESVEKEQRDIDTFLERNIDTNFW
jgi:hypothetical protein